MPTERSRLPMARPREPSPATPITSIWLRKGTSSRLPVKHEQHGQGAGEARAADAGRPHQLQQLAPAARLAQRGSFYPAGQQVREERIELVLSWRLEQHRAQYQAWHLGRLSGTR